MDDVVPEDGEHVFGSGKPVEDLQPFLFADRIDEGVFPRMILAGQPAAELRQPTEGERRRTALAPQLAGREHRDGGRIQPAAQMDAHGVRASQTVLHRPREKVHERFRVDCVRGRPGLRRLFRAPVPVQPRRVRPRP